MQFSFDQILPSIFIQAIHMLILTLEMDTYCNKKYVLMFLKYFLHFAGSLMFTTEYLLQKFFK